MCSNKIVVKAINIHDCYSKMRKKFPNLFKKNFCLMSEIFKHTRSTIKIALFENTKMFKLQTTLIKIGLSVTKIEKIDHFCWHENSF